jgi:hypothetical protein
LAARGHAELKRAFAQKGFHERDGSLHPATVFFYSEIAICRCKVDKTLTREKSAAGSFFNTEGYREPHAHGLAFFN